jgi:hypothetical protein
VSYGDGPGLGYVPVRGTKTKRRENDDDSDYVPHSSSQESDSGRKTRGGTKIARHISRSSSHPIGGRGGVKSGISLARYHPRG